MPLSEEELRLLEQMERALVAEDPKLASTLRGTKLRKQARRQMFLGILAFIVGIAVLMGGAILQKPVIGVAGFVIMLGSAYLTLTSYKGRNRALSTPPPASSADPNAGLRVVQGGRAHRTRPSGGRSRTPRPPKQGSMMERFEERWRRRREQNGGM